MTDVLNRLNSLVEAERDALLSGDLQRVEGLLSEKTALAAELAQHDLPPEKLGRVRRALARNQDLFERALEGVQNVMTRMAAMQKARRSLETYDSSGNRTSHAGHAGSGNGRLEKRA